MRDGDATPLVQAAATAERLVRNLGEALKGKEAVARMAVICLLARGHLLIEDLPGVGKTTLARALSASLGIEFRRVQFTSDLMPTDLLGGNVYDPSTGRFSFRPGPIFTQILLADEINRTTPKTQSALLEAMEEGQVSIEGTTHPLPQPFMVVATQNPQDFYGTYPLPESQLDRFLLRVAIGYPPTEVERAILERPGASEPVVALSPVVTVEELRAAQGAVSGVHVAGPVLDYLHEIVLATRSSDLLDYGASTRGALALVQAVRARAIAHGREHVTPDDVKEMAEPVLAHRVRALDAGDRRAAREIGERAVRELLSRTVVPV